MYTLKILSSEDFDKLPYKHAKTSLGAADAKTGVAYVRDTGYNDITKATISHELDELVTNVSPHEEDGIRYKSLASLGAGAGAGALSSLIPGLKNFSPIISAGAGALANRKGQPWKGALQGFAGGGAGSALLGGGKAALQGLTQPGGTFGKAWEGFMPGVKQAGLNYAGAIPGMGGIGTANPTGRIAQVLSKFGSGGTTGATGATPATVGALKQPAAISATPPMTRIGSNASVQAPSAIQTATNTENIGTSIMDQFKKMIPGMAVSMSGNMFAPKVDVPDIAGVGERLKGELQAGTMGDPVAKKMGMAELSRVLNQNIGEVPSTAFTLGDIENEQAKTKALQNYTNHFKSIRPGADFQNDPEFLRGYTEIENKYDQIRVAQRDQMQFEYNQQQLQQKYQYMVQALGIDQYQMQQYVQLAQLEIDQLMLEYGLSVEEATQFKQMFGDLGQIMMQGQQPQQSVDVQALMDLFKGGQA